MKYIGKAAIGRAQNLAMNQVNGLKNQFSNPTNQRNVDLEWNNYNYPPLIRLFHYSTDRLQNPIQRVVRVLHYSFLAYLVLCVINFLNNIVIAACGVSPGIYILYSILNVLLLVPFSLFVFYSGFYGLWKKPRTCHMLAYRISQGIQCALYIF